MAWQLCLRPQGGVKLLKGNWACRAFVHCPVSSRSYSRTPACLPARARMVAGVCRDANQSKQRVELHGGIRVPAAAGLRVLAQQGRWRQRHFPGVQRSAAPLPPPNCAPCSAMRLCAYAARPVFPSSGWPPVLRVWQLYAQASACGPACMHVHRDDCLQIVGGSLYDIYSRCLGEGDRCKGFNTEGWVKFSISSLGTTAAFGTGCAGLYARMPGALSGCCGTSPAVRCTSGTQSGARHACTRCRCVGALTHAPPSTDPHPCTKSAGAACDHGMGSWAPQKRHATHAVTAHGHGPGLYPSH